MTRLKNRDVLSVAELTYSNFTNDIIKFSEFSNSFSSDFAQQLNQSIEKLRKQITPSELTLQIVEQKRKYFSILADIRIHLAKLEDMCVLYKNRLIVPIGQFKLYEVRREIRKENVNGIYSGLEATIGAIRKNIPQLASVGFTSNLIEELNELRTLLVSTKKEVDACEKKQKALFDAHQDEILELEKQISRINKYGKLIFRNYNTERRELYTMANSIKAIRAQEKAMLQNKE